MGDPRADADARLRRRRHHDALGFEIFGVEKRCLSVDGVYVDEEHRMLDLNRVRR